ncbi:EF-hand domain-containing protein [Pseudoalteromonas shioyasakiensis]|uniref:EF-hand domain-containing protein n=1 Tax=Pseudoalteromonas TaxID=53246 RepID=UPI000C8A0833|nr:MULTISPECIES: EF-hand domain-containing protein [Pseudoalteromonas]MAD04983.1 cag pathogenicity island protein Cag25 [Pseudoalteromonas sp.]MCG9707287.1 EF-hand domain-containing protein [Pseudoalteromonas sp. Isolate3]MCP4585480.1 EF-hand domain-containing protein [Pseudoalteromonas sp.]MCQ8880998.1 EF-hand domain-containing protein [Pseudoalteromonas shioyasakiensis]NIZ06834.1 EF-hand domain-containing protein [Pseudoalteromonas sp. HF66]|tara:strand:- start:24732 stop:24959 length:228 start_codon:yes stop_codon:yes gene_type:complete
MKITAISAAVLINLVTVDCYAFDLQTTFNELDKDSNGFLSEAEASEDALLHSNFTQIDSNQDGQISFSEFQSFIQ